MTALEPSRFRSPLLAALPETPPGRDRRLLRRRRLGIVAALALVTVPAVAVAVRWLPVRGYGQALYRLHDEVYLPLKGYLYTWLYPGSLTYLLAALTLAVFALAAAVWRRPLTPRWQAALGRRVLRWRWTRPALARWGRLFKSAQARLQSWADRPGKRRTVAPRQRPSTPTWRQRILQRRAAWLAGPTLLEELVDDERRGALERLDAADPASAEAVRALPSAVELSVLAARIQAHPRATGEESLRAVARLDQALLRLDLVRAARDAAASDPAIGELRADLESEIAALLAPLVPARLGPPGFSLPTLAAELALLLGVDGPSTWPDEPARERWVLEGIAARRRRLDESRQRLERWSAYVHRRRLRPPPFPGSELHGPGSRLEARLALDVALFAALRRGAPRLALAFVESFEGLRFALLMTAAEPLLAPFDGLPQTLDYRVPADLLDRRLAADAELAEARRRRSAVLSEADLRLAAARHAELYAAAADPRSPAGL